MDRQTDTITTENGPENPEGTPVRPAFISQIRTKIGYEVVKKRLTTGEQKILAAGGFLKAPVQYTKWYQHLADLQLQYELEHNLVTI
jgi:hypothetical protein